MAQGANNSANGKLIKGAGCGTRQWQEDLVFTDTDGATPLFKVAQASGNTTVAGTLAVTGALTATGGVTGGLTGAVTATTISASGLSSLNGGATVGASAATLEGTLTKQLTAASTATGTTPQVLQTYTLPAGTLASTGQGVRITAWGTTALNGNTKTMALTFGATTVTTTNGSPVGSGAPWYITALVYRTGATTQVAVGEARAGTALFAGTNSTPAETLSGAVTITMTATDGTSSAGDITCNGMTVEYLS